METPRLRSWNWVARLRKPADGGTYYAGASNIILAYDEDDARRRAVEEIQMDYPPGSGVVVENIEIRVTDPVRLLVLAARLAEEMAQED